MLWMRVCEGRKRPREGLGEARRRPEEGQKKAYRRPERA